MVNVPYNASTIEGGAQFINIDDLEQQAKALLPVGGYGYISSGAGDLWTLEQNVKAFDHKLIPLRVLQNVKNPDTKTKIFDTEIDVPIITAPMASHRLAHERGELVTSRGTANSGTIYTLGSYSSYDIDEVRESMGADAPFWFQFYMREDKDLNKAILDRVMSYGAKAIALTADATIGGNREMDQRTGFVFPFGQPIMEYHSKGNNDGSYEGYHQSKQDLSPEDVQFIAEYTGLPVFVKGVQTAEDAELSIQAGAGGIWVSNHGGRQLDAGVASFDALQEVAATVDKRVPVIFDSGIRRGTHVFKALASGADLVAIGRPLLYGAAAGGERGVEQVYEFFKMELEKTMQLAGAQTVEDIKNTKLRDYPWGK